MEAQEAKRTFVASLIAAKRKFRKIAKDHVGVHNSKHATLESCIDAIEPALNECGLVSVQFMKGKSLVTKLMHVDGHEEGGIHDLPIPESGNANHAEGGAMTYFRRYDYLAVVNQQPEGEDADGAGFNNSNGFANVKKGSGVINEKQLNRLYAIAGSSKWNPAQVMAFVDKNFSKEPVQIAWGDEYDRICKYFENNVNQNPR